MLYLTVEEEDIGISLLTFVPQVVLLLALAKKFGNINDLPFCLFCQTHVFVVYNKVSSFYDILRHEPFHTHHAHILNLEPFVGHYISVLLVVPWAPSPVSASTPSYQK